MRCRRIGGSSGRCSGRLTGRVVAGSSSVLHERSQLDNGLCHEQVAPAVGKRSEAAATRLLDALDDLRVFENDLLL